MAAAESGTNQSVHSEVLGTDDSDKKKAGKFQPFKKLFGKRKKREPAPGCEEAKLKPSHSFGNVCNGTFSSDEEPNGALRSSHYSMGSRAFSHDSIFIPDGRTESEQAIQAMSQENVLGKVKTLQQQLAKNIKFGQPPQMTISVRTMGEANTSMEEDVLLSSPMEIETQQDTVISRSGNKSTDTPGLLRTMTLPGTGYEMEEKIAPVKSSRPKRQFSCSGTIETINLDAVPQAVARLDNSAAKHKLAVKPKKQRMSRKHKRLTKGSQSLTITEFEPEDLETELYGDRYPGYNGHIIADKLIQKRDEQKQLQPAEEKRIEDHWGIFEAERIRQIVEMEEQKEMEEQRCQKLEQMQKEQERRHCDEERRQYLLEGETSLKTELKACNKEERRLLETEKRQELEKQRCQELEKQRQKELEEQQGRKQEEQSHQEQEQQRRELEEQKRQEQEQQQRQECEKQQRQDLEKQKLQEWEEQQRRDLVEKKLQEKEEQQRQDLEEQKLQDWEKQQRGELEEQKLQEREEQQTQDLEEQKLWDWEKQQRGELEEQKLQEWEEQQRQDLEEQKLQDREKQQRGELEEQKLQEWEEQQRQDLEEQKLQDREKQQRGELEEQKLQEWEEQQRQDLEEQKLQEQEEQQRRDLEEQKLQEWEEKQGQDLEEQKLQEWEEKQGQDLEEQKHQEWEVQRCQELEEQKHQEQRHQELEERRQELEEQRRLELEELRHKIENQCQEEEERNWLKEEKEFREQNKKEKQRRELEEKELEEAEIKLKQEKEAESLKEQKKQEEQRQQLKEKGEKTEKEQPQEDKKKKWEEHRKHKLKKQMHMESSDGMQEDELKQQKEQNEQKWNIPEEQEIDTERQNPQQNQQEKSLEQQQDKDQLCSVGVDRHLVEEKLQERSRSQKLKQTEKGNKTAEEILAQKLKREVEAQEQKRIGEELRWQEVDERQTASRPFTFQVSSGDKQIIFQKVNLSPVMPVKGAGVSSPSIKDSRMHTASKGSHTLPSSVCVPHTAILVTGAQLCGTAVNLNQIKDTACKSLLGLTEERKNVDIPSPEKAQKKTQDPKPSSSKMKYAQESLNNQAVLAEWASIRSRILKNAESSKYNEKDRVSVCRHSDDWTPRGRGAPHGNLRKTLSANAKFSIMPAWQKFSDASKNNIDAENVSVATGNETVAVGRTTGLSADSKEDVASTFKDNLAEKAKEKMETHREITDNTEGCKFAKDLPSFLVPNFPHSPGKELPQAELPGVLENQQNNSTKKADKPAPNGEENVSPFGIKLRRTNYSLRFHYDQQAEQRKKKRYSAGDSFDGVPDPLVTTEGEKESEVFAPQESTPPGTGRVNVPGNLKDSKDSSVTAMETSQPAVTPVVLLATGQSALAPQEKPAGKSLLQQKPALAPKPTSQTPPSSPLSKINRSSLSDALGQRLVKTESDGGWRREDRANAARSTPSSEYKNEDEEIREKKSFFPSISIPWREKNDKKPEPLKREKPVLQSRHSLDGSKLMEKVETSQPLWITLALQKQKGFREQQATREERRQAREAKQAEKLAKENAAGSNQPDNKSSSSKTSTLQKSTTQEGEKKIETTVSRLERREQLKKSNTLPTSVTVEISDSVPSTPTAKEVAKRFSTPDANPVSTEPAWLALAKRKAKAWSDCPQIIK